tara:strand:- start:571 stop:840 length:270 start_codon:yes stop_codon:yes gene_type:complete
MKKFDRYKVNLRQIGNDIYSYDTHVAEIIGDYLYKLKWNVKGMTSSPTTSKHINYVANELGLTVIENGQWKDEYWSTLNSDEKLKFRIK